MIQNKDGLYNETEHEMWTMYDSFRNAYPLIDIEFIDFCKWLNSQVKTLRGQNESTA
jgi:hypothetical protein